MYLHIGRDWMIPYSTIIGLFPCSILNYSPEFRLLFHDRRLRGQVLGDWDDAKTVVLTDTRIYLSSISPSTLRRRVERQDSPFE